MKTLKIKTIVLITLLSIFATSCTDLNDDDRSLDNNIENTEINGYTGDEKGGGEEGKE